MPSLRLGRTAFKALDGNIYEESVTIERETPKAILLRIEKRGVRKEHWIPRSVCVIRTRTLIRIVDGEPVDQGPVSEIHITEWFWKKEIEEASG
jgi:hypothetical protein